MMKPIITMVLFCGTSLSLFAQYTPPSEEQDENKSKVEQEKVYKVNPWISGGLTVVGLYTNSVGFDRLQDKDDFTPEEIASLNPDDIPGIDRSGLRQDPEKRDDAAKTSDVFLLGSSLLPATLFIDKRIRKDWLDITLMYLETQAIASNFYSWGPIGPTFIDRIRPQAYYPALAFEEKESGNGRNSFFSGHVSSTATGTFFFAKVYTDYHPELGAKKWIFYGLAAVPPVITSILRVQALKHWPTDTIVGSIVGASIGYFVPQIHKNWQRKHRSKLNINANYSAAFKGMGIQLTF